MIVSEICPSPPLVPWELLAFNYGSTNASIILPILPIQFKVVSSSSKGFGKVFCVMYDAVIDNHIEILHQIPKQ